MNLSMGALAGLIVILPVIGFFIEGFFGKRLPRKGDWLTTGIMGVVTLCSLTVFVRVFNQHSPYAGVSEYYYWFNLTPTLKLHVGYLIDNLSAIMVVVVSVVSFLVHLFSIGYMHGDRHYVRYYTVLQLFSAAMLGLVLSDNLLTLYICWELMGLSSYLLIGHFFDKKSAADASLKAFMTTRVGDVLMFVGIMIIFWQVGSLRYVDIFTAVANGSFAGSWRLWAGLLLFGGAVGKSAQFPLHVWLPDAMEGPTPVSALIHAATMVAAGVYLVARMYLLLTPETFLVIAYVGGFTAIFAATIGVVMDDIKKVLAYSTVSQLGYMMLGLGVGGFVMTGYTGGVYHLMTHAFFKACLFLGSGSVIHAVHTQSMARMGGLRKKIPITFAAILVATLALTGFPYITSGFWSKDTIIAAAIEFAMRYPKHWLLPMFAIGAACLTAFYMFRLIFLTFFGEPRDQHAHDHAHEGSWVITVPLIVLALLSFYPVGGPAGNWFWFRNPTPNRGEISQRFGKLTGSATVFHPASELAEQRADSMPMVTDATSEGTESGKGAHEAAGEAQEGGHAEHFAHVMAVRASIAALLLGFSLAWLTYIRRFIKAENVASRFSFIHKVLVNKYYMDEFYQVAVIKPFMAFCSFVASFDKWVIDGLVNLAGLVTRGFSAIVGVADSHIVDGAVNYVADVTMSAGRGLSRLQTGRIGNYLMGVLAGVVFLAGIVFWLLGR